MDYFRSEPFYFKVSGLYGLFTDPVTKAGGEKYTYQIPTYQALKGITEEIYWKPTIYYVVDSFKVNKPFKTETKGIRAPLNAGGNDLNYYTYLKDVEYLVKFHFEWNLNRDDLKMDRNEKKHQQILIRSLKKGGRRDAFLGTRECVANVEYITEREYLQETTPFANQSISMGIMFHSFTYPGESTTKCNRLISNFSSVTLKNGEVKFLRPEECEIRHDLGNYSIRDFKYDEMKSVDKETTEYDLEEGIK